MDALVLTWCCTITPTITEEEYATCCNAMAEAWPGNPTVQRLKDLPPTFDTLRNMLTYLIPLLMMRQHRIPRSKWVLYETDRGKKWIERTPDGMHPSRHLSSTLGYTTAWDANMVVMAAAQGKRHQVINIGVNVRRMGPGGIPVAQWAQGHQHKLTPLEMTAVTGVPDRTVLSRINILLTVKESLMDALGTSGCELSRIEADIPENIIRVDGQALLGWEFRVFRSQQECILNDKRIIEQYQYCVAFFRGNNVTKFWLIDDPREIDKLTQYFLFDNLLKVLPRLTQDT